MKKGIVGLSAMALMAGALLVGCGSSGGSTASETALTSDSKTSAHDSKPLSKAAFLDQAEEICEAGGLEKDGDVSSALAKLEGQPSPKDLRKIIVATVLPAYYEIIEKLDRLSAPEADQAQIDSMLQRYRSALRIAEHAPEKAVHQYLFKSAVDAAEAYGITGCSF